MPSEVIIGLEEMAADPNDDVAMILQNNEDELENLNEINEKVEEPIVTFELEQTEQGEDIPKRMEIEEETPELAGMEERVEDESNEDLRNEDQDVDVSTTDDTVVIANGEQRKELEQRYRYNLRAKRDRDYSYRFTLLPLKAGIKHWGKKAKEAMRDELKVFLNEAVFEGLKNPTRKQM